VSTVLVTVFPQVLRSETFLVGCREYAFKVPTGALVYYNSCIAYMVFMGPLLLDLAVFLLEVIFGTDRIKLLKQS
jgi:hypothetical protein